MRRTEGLTATDYLSDILGELVAQRQVNERIATATERLVTMLEEEREAAGVACPQCEWNLPCAEHPPE